ncbi:MAG: TetR family transcriptional regulator [Acidimicrobiia bacterium]|nr:TetR family transcriptional regulator [Acidimicrobiia bacterium]
MSGGSRLDDGADSLRARNMSRNRREVADVAVALFTERGFDAVTVDDIAEAAGVSRRTFFRYFASKEDAALPYEDERLEQLRVGLAERPPEEPVLASVRAVARAVAATISQNDRSGTLARLRIVQQEPAVHARSLELQARWEDEVRHLVAEHLGEDPETSLHARVVAAASVATVRATIEQWAGDDGQPDLVALIDEAFDVLTSGLALAAE